LHYKKSLWA